MGRQHQKWKMFMITAQQNMLKTLEFQQQPAGVTMSVLHEAISSEFSMRDFQSSLHHFLTKNLI